MTLNPKQKTAAPKEPLWDKDSKLSKSELLKQSRSQRHKEKHLTAPNEPLWGKVAKSAKKSKTRNHKQKFIKEHLTTNYTNIYKLLKISPPYKGGLENYPATNCNFQKAKVRDAQKNKNRNHQKTSMDSSLLLRSSLRMWSSRNSPSAIFPGAYDQASARSYVHKNALSDP